jgi:phage terminase large subunit
MEIDLIEAFEMLPIPKRIKCFFGGRGAAKSETFAEVLVILAHARGDRILCAREFQNSIEDSSYALIVAKIDKLGLREFFDIQATAIYGRYNGSCFKFVGLARNIQSLKSKFGYTICWIEEAETVAEKTWNLLLPTIRAEGSEVWISFNPNEAVAATYVQFVAPYLDAINAQGFYEDEYIYVRKVSWRDNPYFPDTLRQEMERDKKSNYKKYLHVWEGECNADYADSIIESEWVDAAIDSHLKLNYKPRGERVLSFDPADSGQDAKATAMRYGMLVNNVKQWRDGDLTSAIALAFDDAFEFRADVLVYDSIGVGAGVKVGLKERIGERQIDVVGFGGGDSPTNGKYKEDRLNEDVFRNKRAQFWWLLRDRFERTYQAVEHGEYADPVDMISLSSTIKDLDLLKAELVRQQRKRSASSRLIQLVSKDEMRAQGIPSPNMADSLMMAWAIPVQRKKLESKPIVRRPAMGGGGWMG